MPAGKRRKRPGVGYLTPAARAYSPALQARLVRELIAPEGAPLVADLFGTGRPQVAPAVNTYDPDEPRDEAGQWTDGGGGSIHAITKASSLKDLRAANGGVAGTYDDEEFHDKVLIPLHNHNDYRPLLRFSEKNPRQFEKLRTAAMFHLWRDSNHPAGSLPEFMDRGAVTVYRGVEGGGAAAGRGWTLRQDVASAFSRHGPGTGLRAGGSAGGSVLTKRVHVGDILYYSDLQGEQEVVLRHPTANVFCPTGPGGGVDPTCTAGAGAAAGWIGTHPTKGKFAVTSVGETGNAEVTFAGGHKGLLFKHELEESDFGHGTAAPEPAAPAAVELPDPDKVKVLKTLPGSTQPRLVEDASGKRWVMKAGAGKEPQLRNEAAADAAYRAAGVPVPRGGLVETPGGPVKFTEYHEGVQTLGEWEHGKTAGEKLAVYKQLRQHLVTDALLANWDVVGLTKDNVLVTPDGKALRADNGGGLLYRAQGSPKGDKFGPNVGELFSLRDPTVNPSAASVFKGMTDKEVTDQIPGVLQKRQAILDAVPDAKTKEILGKRFDYLQKLHGQSSTPAAAPPTSPPPPKPAAPKPASDKAPPKLDSGAALAAHVQANAGGVKFTKLHLAKIAYLNPAGVQNNTFVTPQTASKESDAAQLARLKQILPAGTQIQTVDVKGYHVTAQAPAPLHKAKLKATATGEAFGKGVGAAFGESEKGGPSKFSSGESTAADNEHYFAASHGVRFAGTKVKGGAEAWKEVGPILEAQEAAYWPKLTGGERAAVKSYTSGGYKSLNEEMRSCAPDYDCLGEYNKTKYQNLLSAMEKAPPLAQPVNVRRGISVSSHTAEKIMAEAEEIRKSGGTFTLPGFTSTSARKPFGGSLGFDILARTGLYVEGHTSVDGEYELLQSPKTKYKVLGTSKKGGKTVLHLEEVA